jgi:hypothetical protein
LKGNDNAVGMTDLVAMDFNPWKKEPDPANMNFNP